MQEPPVRLRREFLHIDRLPARLRPPHRVFRLLPRRQPPVRNDHLARSSRSLDAAAAMAAQSGYRAPASAISATPAAAPRSYARAAAGFFPPAAPPRRTPPFPGLPTPGTASPRTAGPVTGTSSRTTHARPRGNAHAARARCSLLPLPLRERAGVRGAFASSHHRRAAGSVPARHRATSALNRRSSRRMRFLRQP